MILPFRSARLACLSTLILLFAFCPSTQGACPKDPGRLATELIPGSVLRLSSIPASFQLFATAGQRLRIVARSRHVDLALCLYDSAGHLLITQDGLWSVWEDEEIVRVIERPTRYRLVVVETAETNGGERPDPEIELTFERSAGVRPVDRERMEAQERLVGGAEAFRSSQFEKAGRLLDEAAAAWRRLGDSSGLLEAEFRRAEVSLRLGRTDARTRFLALLEEPALTKYARAWTARKLAEIDLLAGDWESGIAWFERALSDFELAGATEEKPDHLWELAIHASRFGLADRALGCYREAAEIHARLGQTEPEAEALLRMGNLLGFWERREEALPLFDRAIAELTPAGPSALVARVRTARGSFLAHLGRTAEAHAELSAALEILAGLELPDLEANTRVNLCFVLRQRGDYELALENCRLALEIHANLDHPNTAVSRYSLGLALRNLGRFDEARSALEHARREARALGDPSLEAAALLAVARIEFTQERFSAATRTALSALDALEPAVLDSRISDLRMSFLGERAGYYWLAIDALLAQATGADRSRFLQRAFEVDERFRARELLDLILGGRRRSAGPEGDEIRAAEASLIADTQQSSTAVEREQAWRKHSLFLARLPGGMPLRAGRPVTLSEIQEELAPQDLLLQIQLRDDSGLVWMVTRDDLGLVRLPGRVELESDLRAAVTSLSRGGSGENPALDRLGRELLGPLGQALAGRTRLIVVADAPLQGFPWAALVDPATGERLVERLEILQAPSSSVLVALGDRPSTATEPRILALGEPTFAPLGSGLPTWTPLPASGRELEAIARHAGRGRSQWRVDLLRDRDASRERLFQSKWPAIRILHLATHGELDLVAPHLSHLALAQIDAEGVRSDGRLFAYEVAARLPLATDLVVLSGCNTAQGTAFAGEGLIGLTHAFLAAGTQRVLATLWPIRDDDAAAFMDRFYFHHLREGLSEGAALRAAQIDLHRRGSPPAAWAGFVLQGRLSPSSRG